MSSHRSPADIRSSLDHPIIDGDGHWVEYNPVFAERMRKVAGDKADLSYKVSVTGQGGSHVGDPKWTNNFDVSIPLTKDKPSNVLADNASVTIPVSKNENGDFYRIYVYLQLTEKELAYNRRNPQQ